MIWRPDVNPIRLLQDRSYDFSNTFQTISQQPSCYSAPNKGKLHFDQLWAVGIELQFQLLQQYNTNVTVWVEVNGSPTTLTAENITPTGWSGDGNYAMLYKYTPATTGKMVFKVKEEVITDQFEYYNSDNIDVKVSLPEAFRMDYYNSDNTKNVVFFKDNERQFFPTLFLKGYADEGVIATEKSGFPDLQGNLQILRTTPRKGLKVQAFAIPDAFIYNIHMIFNSNIININGGSYNSENNLNKETIEGSNGYSDLELDLYATDYQYVSYYNPVYSITPPFDTDLLFWYKKNGSVYEDQLSSLVLNIIAGQVNFNPAGSADSKFVIFDRSVSGIQNDRSREADDYNPLSKYNYNVSAITQKDFDKYFDPGNEGRICIRPDGSEILVYLTDKTLLLDEQVLEYIDLNSYALDALDNQNVIENNYNILDI